MESNISSQMAEAPSFSSLRASVKMQIMICMNLDICHGMDSPKMLYFMTWTYIFKVKHFNS